MRGSPLPYSQWVIAIYLLTSSNKGVSSARFARDVGVTQKTAWFLAHRIPEAMGSGDPLFEGPVEVDETYVGGPDRIRHFDRKVWNRSLSGRTVVVGMRDRATDQVRTAVISSPTSDNLVEFVHSNVESVAHTPVYTDGLQTYGNLWTSGHRSVNHSERLYGES